MKAAMNRLRESKKLSQTAAYCLASAYALDGRADVAGKLIERAERTHYESYGGMFQSSLRDEAIKMLAYTLCNNQAKAIPIARKIANQCTGRNYVTQDIAFATIAMHSLSDLAGGGNISVKLTEQGQKPLSLQNISKIKNLDLTPSCGSVEVTDFGKSNVVLSLANTYQPSPQEKLKAENRGLSLSVTYTDIKGKPLSISRLKQDTEFYANITVVNKGGDVPSMAMTYTVPSGWEIWNSRLFGSAEKAVDYRDIRDDKVIYYSSLDAGKKMTFKIRLRAAYTGRFALPPVVCEDMYYPSYRALTENTWVSVEK